jgi:hypothetical protein
MAIHLHHVDRIGMGNDRETVNDSEYRKMMLCAEKHNEVHNIGQLAFNEKYGVYGVLYNESEELKNDT